MAGDVVDNYEAVFEEVHPFMYLEEGSFFISLRNKRNDQTGARHYVQIMELHRMGHTVDERVRTMKECLQVSLQDAREYFCEPDMLAEMDGKFMEIIQHRIMFRMLLKPHEIVWVYTGRMLVPMWAVAHRQYWEEKQKEGFVQEHFFRGCLFAIMYVIENYKIPRHRLLDVPDDPPPFSMWFSSKLPENERIRYTKATQEWWPYVTILMKTKNKSEHDWGLVRKLMKYVVPEDLPEEEVHSWKCTFLDIISSNFDREAHLAGFYETIHSKITVMYLPYRIRKLKPINKIPDDVSPIEMHFTDQTALKKIDLLENLFFYTVSAMYLRLKSARKLYKMIILKFLMTKRSSYVNENLQVLFDEELQELKISGIEYGKEGFYYARYNSHVFHFRYRELSLSFLLHEIEISSDCLASIMSQKEDVKNLVHLLEETDISKQSYFQQAMVNVARCVFAYSETYCGLKLKDDSSKRRNEANLKKAQIINDECFRPVNTPPRHVQRVKDILSQAEALNNVKIEERMGTCYRDQCGVLRGVGAIVEVKKAEVTLKNELDQDDFFLSQNHISAMFDRFLRDSLLYHTMPEFHDEDECKINFLVFLCPRHITVFPKEVEKIIRKEKPWLYQGVMRTRPQSDDGPNFARYINFANSVDNFVAFPSDRSNFMSHFDLHEKFDKICASCKNVRMFISSVSSSMYSGESAGLPGIGLIQTSHFSWYPSTCDPTNLFGGRCFELRKEDHPLEVWSKDIVIAKKGPETVFTRPIPCSLCMTYSKTMYVKCKREQVFLCSNCVPGDFKGLCKIFYPEPGWTPMTMYEDFGFICSVGDSNRHVLWTTGWMPHFKSDFSSMRKLPDTSRKVPTKRKPTFLLGSRKVPKLAKHVDISHDVVFDWLDDEPESIPPEWLNEQYFVRSKGDVSLHWHHIYEKVSNCKCYSDLKAWKISKRFFKPKPLESKKAQDERLGPRPKPTFLCCGKDVTFRQSQFDLAKKILGLPPGNKDRLTLMRCNDFLKLYLTLFSERGRESSLREACSWRGEGEVPSHCMFFGEERLNIPFIRGVCMETLSMNGL